MSSQDIKMRTDAEVLVAAVDMYQKRKEAIFTVQVRPPFLPGAQELTKPISPQQVGRLVLSAASSGSGLAGPGLAGSLAMPLTGGQ